MDTCSMDTCGGPCTLCCITRTRYTHMCMYVLCIYLLMYVVLCHVVCHVVCYIVLECYNGVSEMLSCTYTSLVRLDQN